MTEMKEIYQPARQGENSQNGKVTQRLGYLPNDSVDFICQMNKKEITQVNLYLLQNRFRVETETKKSNKPKPSYKESPFLVEIIKNEYEHTLSSQMLYGRKMGILLKHLLERNKEMAGSFSEKAEYCFHISNKMILGEGGNSVYSDHVLLKLHPLYGVPYLPASTIKGALRSCWNELFERKEGNDTGDVEHQLFEEGEKKMIFFDAYPQRFSITLDAQSPHYKAYYEQQAAPTDNQNVVPITFICLKNVTFKLHFAFQNKTLWKQEKTRIDEAVKCMVETYGLGAKTALGYGAGEMQ